MIADLRPSVDGDTKSPCMILTQVLKYTTGPAEPRFGKQPQARVRTGNAHAQRSQAWRASVSAVRL